jgi:hypothetical protein
VADLVPWHTSRRYEGLRADISDAGQCPLITLEPSTVFRMDTQEAREVLSVEILALRARTYTELLDQFKVPVAKTIEGPSGKAYQVEVTSFFDDRATRNLRVVASIDDGGLKALKPFTSDFIVGPSGAFVGE